MSQVQVVGKIKLPKEIIEHLKLEMKVWQNEDEFKIAKKQERRIFENLLKDNGKLERYDEITEKIKELKKSPNLDIKQYVELLKEKTEIAMTIKSNLTWIKAHEKTKERSREYRETYKTLKTDFTKNILPILSLAEIE